jgi:hypothetical protein
VTDRPHHLAAHTRMLDDDRLNGLLAELPPAQFAKLLHGALARPRAREGFIALRFQGVPARLGEVSRWAVLAPVRSPATDPVEAWRTLGQVAQVELGTAGRGWVRCLCQPNLADARSWACTCGDGQVPQQRRFDAACALAEAAPATGARCRLLAVHVRGLDDDALSRLLVELPRARFVALLAVAGQARRRGVAA